MDGAWTTCDGASPSAEVCDNGLDDDCDGDVDGQDSDCAPADLSALQTTEGVDVDGDLGEYTAADALEFSAGSDGDNTVASLARWDDKKLYVGFRVEDDSVEVDSASRDGDVFLNDGVELFLDINHDGGAHLGTDDYHFIVDADGVIWDGRGTGASGNFGDKSWDSSMSSPDSSAEPLVVARLDGCSINSSHQGKSTKMTSFLRLASNIKACRPPGIPTFVYITRQTPAGGIMQILQRSMVIFAIIATVGCSQIDADEPNGEPSSSATNTSGQTACQTIEGDVVIESAADFDKLGQIDGCFEITGSLFIQGTTDIVNLRELHGLEAVGGSIGISDNEALRIISFFGFFNLVEVGEGLVIEGNPLLEDIAFFSLESVGGNVHIFNNPSLVSISRMDSLQTVGGEFIIAGNDALEALSAEALTSVGAKMIIENNDLLVEAVFDSLQTIGGDLRVRFNRSLTQLRLQVLQRVGDNLMIVRNPLLDRVALLALARVGGDLRITDNASLAACVVDQLPGVSDPGIVEGNVIVSGNGDDDPADCPTACTVSGDVIIDDQQDLDRFAQLGCDVIDGFLFIQDTALTNLDGLETLREVTRDVLITGNDALVSIAGLRNLEEFGGRLSIIDNATLPAVDGLQSLTSTLFRGIAGASIIEISNNPALTSLEGLSSLTEAGHLHIENNDALPDLLDLNALGSAFELRILDNDNLVNLRGLDSFTFVTGFCLRTPRDGFLEISGNDSLQSLEGLNNLQSVASATIIADNPSLTSIEALSSLQNAGSCHRRPGLQIINNDALTNLDGYDMAEPTGLILRDNDSLADISALTVLESPFVLRIENNDALTNLDALSNLADVGFRDPAGRRPHRSSINGGLFIIGNAELADLDGLSQLGTATDFGGHITIEDNPRLTNISGLTNVVQAGRLVIRNNDALVDLAGLENLRRIIRVTDAIRFGVNDLIIEDNDALETVGALFGVEFIRNALAVVDNPTLPTCEVQALVDAIGLANIGEPPVISGNDDSATCP